MEQVIKKVVTTTLVLRFDDCLTSHKQAQEAIDEAAANFDESSEHFTYDKTTNEMLVVEVE